MNDFEIVLIIFAGLFVGGILAYALNKNDFVAMFLWLFAGAIPGVDLLAGGPSYFNLIIALPLIGVAWRRIHMKRKSQGQVSGI